MTFESPIEELFWRALEPRIATGVSARTQVDAPTSWGRFRLDFVLERGPERVAVECDGAEFHRTGRDEWRDAAILGSGLATSVIRFPGWAITHHPEDCLYFLAMHQPEFFSERGLHFVERMASSDFKELMASRGDDGMLVPVAYRDVERFMGLFVRATTKVERQFWRVLHGILLKHPGTPLDTVIREADGAGK